MDYREIDELKVYLRKGIIEEYLTEEERKSREKIFASKRIMLSSQEITELEQAYIKYEQTVFTVLQDKEVIIEKEKITINGIELKKFLKSQNIEIKNFKLK